MPLTPDDVHNVAFSKPPIGQRGYNEDQVDAFLERVEAALRNPTGSAVTAEEVRGMAFSKPPSGRRGYNEDEVDAFLDLVAAQLTCRGGAASPRLSDFGRRGAPIRNRQLLVSRVALICIAAITAVTLLVSLGFAAYDTCVLLAGTPTTATIEHCTSGPHAHSENGRGGRAGSVFVNRVVNALRFGAEGCTGTWRVGESSHTGSVVGGDVYDYGPQSSPQVRVFGGSAYTVSSLKGSLEALVFIAVIVFVFLLLRRFGARRSRR